MISTAQLKPAKIFHKGTAEFEGQNMGGVTAKWTLEEYHRMVAAGILAEREVELLNGEIIEMAPEGLEHAQTSTDAADYLRSLLGSQVLVREGKPITLPHSQSEPQPDLTLAQPLRDVYRTQHHPYPENIFWVIEYADSTLITDRTTKRIAYATAGIQEYWIVNLRDRVLMVLRNPVMQDMDRSDYQSEQTIATGTISPLAFPEVAIAVQQLIQ
jgi:Uma2 family endonuclease